MTSINGGNGAQIKQLLMQLLSQQGSGNNITQSIGGDSPFAGTQLNGGGRSSCGCPGGCNCCG